MPAWPYPEPPLTDSVVALGPWREQDVPAIVAWAQEPDIVRWSGVPAGYTEAAARTLRGELVSV